jgi:tRNA dimethylallyltransferase
MQKPKLIVVLGPTSSGKSDLAVIIAKKCNGEIISADSRQVYKGMDIGTGKVAKKEMAGVPHFLLDVADPKRRYSVSRFKKEAERAIKDITKRGKVPILCGGTGFYIQAVVDGLILPEVKPNAQLRKELAELSPEELYLRLKKIDPQRARTIDKYNPHRLTRAIEIATALGSVPEVTTVENFDVLQIGITTPDKILRERIHVRLHKRIRRGMVAEVQKLHRNGVSWKRLEELGLEYKHLAQHLQGNVSKERMLDELETAIWHYAKRQKTWFKRDLRTKWVRFEDQKKTLQLVESFLQK